jgi:hypothetical protein
MKFYLFHVENPEGVAEGIEKPKLKEIGPYAYKEVRNKVTFVIFQNFSYLKCIK